MRKTILGAASALVLASPAMAAELAIPPYYSQGPSYQRETHAHTYESRTAPVVVDEVAPPVVVQRPVVVAPPPVVVEEYPVYAAPQAYAYAAPIWGPRWGWGHRHYFHGGW
jgi:opacity protein-like surface antigen